MSFPKFGPGDKVFAKIRGYPPWPAKVDGLADMTPGKIKYNIYFYGDKKQFGVCREEDIFPYAKNKLTLGKIKKNKGFNTAMSQINSEINKNSISDADQAYRPNSPVLQHSNNVSYDDNVSTPQQIEDVSFSNDVLRSIEPQIRPKELLDVLNIESQLLDIDYRVQTSLGLKHADSQACLEELNKLQQLEVTPLMLKKHPEIFDMLVKLTHYVGNTAQWNMSKEEIGRFNTRANNIRMKAKEEYDKLKSLFVIPNEKPFMEFFQEELEKFNYSIKHMSTEDVIRLSKDPTSNLQLHCSVNNNNVPKGS